MALTRRSSWTTGNLAITLAAFLIMIFQVAPLLIIVAASFSNSDYVSFPPDGFSFKWYLAFFSDPVFFSALVLSTNVAVLSSLLATLIGFPAAYVLARVKFRGAGIVRSIFLAPILIPQIILGVALLTFLTQLGFASSFVGLVLAHLVAVLPFVIRTVGSALILLDERVEEAARDLGASNLQTLVMVVAPAVRGSIVAGALFAFVMSWVNVEVSIFLGVSRSYTLPVVIFNFIEYSMTNIIMAASAVTIYIALILVIIIEKVFGLSSLSSR